VAVTAETQEPSYPQAASCLNDGDPDAWFPTGPVDALSPRTRHAMAVCHVCPVKVVCGQQADEREEKYGVWGGELHTEERVRAARTRQRRAASKAAAATDQATVPVVAAEAEAAVLRGMHVAVCASCPTIVTGRTLGEVTGDAGQHSRDTGHSWTYSGPQTVSA